MATQASDTANNTASKRGRGASSDDLAVIAQRAQAFTNASGVAIALSEGNADEIVCRARSGASAPDVGAALRVEGTFTGLCIQSGKELRCDDCETDTRVDTAAIRALNIRSMVVTPIREDNRVTGVLAVFAPTPHAFTITHVAVLKTMADQISVLLQKEKRPRDENSVEASRPPAPVATARPVVATPAPMAPPAVVIKPAPTPRAAAPAVPRVEPVKASAPMEVVPLATPPKREEKRVDSSHRTSFGTFDSVAGEDKKPANRFMMLGIVAVVLVAAAATFAFLKMQKSSSQAQHTQEAANVPAAQPPAASATNQPAPANGAANPAPSAVVVPANNTSTAAAKPAPESETHKSAKNTEKASREVEKPAPADKPAPVVATLNSAPSRIQQQSNAQVPDVAPAFNVANSGSMPAPPSALARPIATSTPSEGKVEQSQLEPLQLIKTVPSPYPVIARARHMSGEVVLEVKVDKDGKVSNPKFISGPIVFRDAAFEAVVQYRFKPAKLNGQPIDQMTQIRLKFHE
ncbi:MAG TPA: TonB family protein [Candidatus Angelobacter sp.]|nr:TonB family protein [Candidatus Angelobacter sp.]